MTVYRYDDENPVGAAVAPLQEMLPRRARTAWRRT
jgi:hypothetical protein